MRFPQWGNRWLSASAAVGIVVFTAGCDNVGWGGSTIELRPPPSKTASEAAPAEEAEVQNEPELPSGELIFAVSILGDSAVATPIAFVSTDSAAPLPPAADPTLSAALSARLNRVGELTLYAQGTRAGSFIPTDLEQIDPLCAGLPSFRGITETREGVVGERGLLATVKTGVTRQSQIGPVQAPPPVRAVRASTLDMALAEISEKGAVWPPSILNIRRDIHLFRRGDSSTGVAATFLYRDQLTPTPAPAGSYSIFVLGEQRGEQMATTYTDFRRGGTAGKLAPRFLGHLDWDNDGEDEVVLELIGDGQRTFRILERTADTYQPILDTQCAPVASASP